MFSSIVNNKNLKNSKNSQFSSSVPCSSCSSSSSHFSSSSSSRYSSSSLKSSKVSIASSNKLNKHLQLFLSFLVFCLIQQNTQGFLLSHRNLFVPFASSKGAKTVLSTVIHQVKENNEKKNNNKEDILFSQQKNQPVRLLGFMALPEEAVKALQNRISISSKKLSENQKSSFTHSRRKRMHHLSILRKIGTPHGQLLLGGGNGRLFGPQKETRELKRTEPLYLVHY
ncbi:hypothetical protein ACQ4LE_008319 [Meloidogyne hapla]